MKNFLDKFQQAWQSQPGRMLDMNPDELLKAARFERRAIVWLDIAVISGFIFFGVLTLRSAFRDIHKDWPWLIASASDTWVVGFILFNQWRRRRAAAHYDQTMLAHVERSIKEIEHRIRLERNLLWWYVLPIALGCMIPPLLFFVREYSKNHWWLLIYTEGTFAAVFYFIVYRVMKYFGRMALESYRQELLAFRALRESLLNTEESQV